uniref:Putative RNA-directed DNA polymerase n=1 Tax=Schizaphis graminum TaxID=13262 RepID=A0A2S2NK37_SCHGA
MSPLSHLDLRHHTLGPSKKIQYSNDSSFQINLSSYHCQSTLVAWYVTNKSLHDDLQIKTIYDTAINFYKRFHGKLPKNRNHLISQLATKTLPDNPTRRLNRNWCRDFLNL